MKKNLIVWIFIIICTILMLVFIKNNVKVVEDRNFANSAIIEIQQPLNSINNIEESTSNKSYKDNFYYSQLNDNSKIIYDSIYANRENLKSGQYSLTFKDEFDVLLKNPTGADTLTMDFQDAWCAFMYDNPSVFYINVSKIEMRMESKSSIFGTDYTVKMGPDSEGNSYLDDIGIDVSTAIQKVELQKDSLIKTLSGTDYDKIKQIHDWLINNVSYDNNETINRYNIYGTLLNKTAVCEGYAKSFKYLLDEIGIESIVVGGEATNSNNETESHAWNYVKLDNQWYGVDATWDDPIVTGGGIVGNDIKYKYFMKPRTSFENNHVEDKSLVDGGTRFTYPTLSIVSL